MSQQTISIGREKAPYPVKVNERRTSPDVGQQSELPFGYSARLQRKDGVVYLRRGQEPNFQLGKDIRLVQDEENDTWEGEYKSTDHYHWLGKHPYDAWEEAVNQGIMSSEWSEENERVAQSHFENTAQFREILEQDLQERGFGVQQE